MTGSWEAVDRALGAREDIDLSWLEPLPPRQTWPLDGESLRFVAALIAELAPPVVVEFGSGYSSRVMAWATGRMTPAGRLVTIENDPLFAQRVRQELPDEVSAGRMAVIEAPLVVRHREGEALPVYLLDASLLDEPAALIVIDGPSQLLGGRAGTLFQAVELARPGTVVLMDDVDRAGESEALADWRRALGDAIEVRPLEGLPNLVAILVTGDPVSVKGPWWLEEPGGWAPQRPPTAAGAGGGR